MLLFFFQRLDRQVQREPLRPTRVEIRVRVRVQVRVRVGVGVRVRVKLRFN
jgi:hypothetical protein